MDIQPDTSAIFEEQKAQTPTYEETILQIKPAPPTLKDTRFLCPVDCLPGVSEVFGNGGTPGQYDFTGWSAEPRSVLDIGANAGAFTLWARFKWPKAFITSYEPNSEAFGFLHNNFKDDDQCTRICAAVGDPLLNQLYEGDTTLLTCSQYKGKRQRADKWQRVEVVKPEDLAPADFVKIDAEGAETYILEHLQFCPTWLAVEAHSSEAVSAVRLFALRNRMMSAIEPLHTPQDTAVLKYRRK